MRKRKRFVQLSLTALLMASGTAHADICLTFGSSTDLFRGNLTGYSAGGSQTLAMIEEGFDRATFGSLTLANGKLRVALAKNTSTAVVSYTCQIDPGQLAGPCQIQVVTSAPLSGTRMDDVGFLEFGCAAVATPQAGDARPPGEQT